MDNNNKGQQWSLAVNEMRMLRLMFGVTKKGKTRNEHVRGSVKWHWRVE